MSKGWVRLPFYASKNSTEVPEWIFDGSSAYCRDVGASGVLGVATPADATRVLQLRVAGRNVEGEVEIILTRSRVGGNNQQLAQRTVRAEGTFDKKLTVDRELRELREEDTLTVSIQASAGAGHQAYIYLVGVQFRLSD